MTERFSKKTLTAYIQRRIDSLQNVWGFDPDYGHLQVAPIAEDRMRTNPIEGGKTDLSTHVDEGQRTYGEFEELRRLAEQLDLPVSLAHKGLVTTMTKTRPRFKRYRPQKDVE